MNRTRILSEISTIFRKTLKQEDIILSEATIAKDVDGWDSLNHAILIGDIQRHFGLKFSLQDVLNLKNVGDICSLIESKINT